MSTERDAIDEIWDEAERELQAAGREFDRFITEGEALTPPLSDEKRKERESRYVQLFTRPPIETQCRRLQGDCLMFGKRAKAVADKMSVPKIFAKLTKKKKPTALSPAEEIKRRSDSPRERRKHEPAV